MVFADGALSWPDGGIVLNLQHDRTKHLARFAPTAQGARLLVDVRLPDTVAARDAVTLHSRQAYSPAYQPRLRRMKRTQAGGLRRVTKGRGLVGSCPCGRAELRFKSSTVSVHARQGQRRRIWQ